MKRIILVTLLALTLLGSSIAMANDGDSDNATATVSLKVNITSPSTGGGGGGGTGQFLSDTNYCGAQSKFWITSTGTVLYTFKAGCVDGPLTVTVEKGTIALDADGKPIKLLSIQENSNPPDPPTGANIITIPYTLEPSGATFVPALTFTWEYDELPEGADEDSLVIAFWNGVEWVEFDCVVDIDAKTITAKVDHFTTFAALVFIPEEEVEVIEVIEEEEPVTPPDEPEVVIEPEEEEVIPVEVVEDEEEPSSFPWWILIVVVLALAAAIYWLVRRVDGYRTLMAGGSHYDE